MDPVSVPDLDRVFKFEHETNGVSRPKANRNKETPFWLVVNLWAGEMMAVWSLSHFFTHKGMEMTGENYCYAEAPDNLRKNGSRMIFPGQ